MNVILAVRHKSHGTCFQIFAIERTLSRIINGKERPNCILLSQQIEAVIFEVDSLCPIFDKSYLEYLINDSSSACTRNGPKYKNTFLIIPTHTNTHLFTISHTHTDNHITSPTSEGISIYLYKLVFLDLLVLSFCRDLMVLFQRAKATLKLGPY